MALLFPQVSGAAADLSKLNRLDGVSVYSDESESRLVMRFKKQWRKKPAPQFFEKSIQFDIKGAYVAPAKRVFDLEDSLVKSAAAYQLSPDVVRLRLFLSEDPRQFAERWVSSSKGGLFIFALKKQAVAEPAPVAAAPTPAASSRPADSPKPAVWYGEPEKEAKEAPSAPAPEQNENTGKPAAEQAKTFAETLDAKAAGSAGDMDGSLKGFLDYEAPKTPEAPSLGGMFIKMISSLSIVLGLVLITAWAGKKYFGKFAPSGGSGQAVRVLASGPIGVKQRVMVVDVGGEVLILGVSDDNITMLSNVHDTETADRFRRMGMASAAPSQRRGLDPSPVTADWAPGFLRKAADGLRIGKMKAPSGKPQALFDSGDEETFAGQMKLAGGGTDDGRETSRDDLMKSVTSAIRKRNGKLRIA